MPAHSWAHVERVVVHCRFPTWNVLTWNFHSTYHKQALTKWITPLQHNGQDCKAMTRFRYSLVLFSGFWFSSFWFHKFAYEYSHRTYPMYYYDTKVGISFCTSHSQTCIPIQHWKRIWIGTSYKNYCMQRVALIISIFFITYIYNSSHDMV